MNFLNNQYQYVNDQYDQYVSEKQIKQKILIIIIIYVTTIQKVKNLIHFKIPFIQLSSPDGQQQPAKPRKPDKKTAQRFLYGAKSELTVEELEVNLNSQQVQQPENVNQDQQQQVSDDETTLSKSIVHRSTSSQNNSQHNNNQQYLQNNNSNQQNQENNQQNQQNNHQHNINNNQQNNQQYNQQNCQQNNQQNNNSLLSKFKELKVSQEKQRQLNELPIDEVVKLLSVATPRRRSANELFKMKLISPKLVGQNVENFEQVSKEQNNQPEYNCNKQKQDVLESIEEAQGMQQMQRTQQQKYAVDSKKANSIQLNNSIQQMQCQPQQPLHPFEPQFNGLQQSSSLEDEPMHQQQQYQNRDQCQTNNEQTQLQNVKQKSAKENEKQASNEKQMLQQTELQTNENQYQQQVKQYQPDIQSPEIQIKMAQPKPKKPKKQKIEKIDLDEMMQSESLHQNKNSCGVVEVQHQIQEQQSNSQHHEQNSLEQQIKMNTLLWKPSEPQNNSQFKPVVSAQSYEQQESIANVSLQPQYYQQQINTKSQLSQQQNTEYTQPALIPVIFTKSQPQQQQLNVFDFKSKKQFDSAIPPPMSKQRSQAQILSQINQILRGFQTNLEQAEYQFFYQRYKVESTAICKQQEFRLEIVDFKSNLSIQNYLNLRKIDNKQQFIFAIIWNEVSEHDRLADIESTLKMFEQKVDEISAKLLQRVQQFLRKMMEFDGVQKLISKILKHFDQIAKEETSFSSFISDTQQKTEYKSSILKNQQSLMPLLQSLVEDPIEPLEQQPIRRANSVIVDQADNTQEPNQPQQKQTQQITQSLKQQPKKEKVKPVSKEDFIMEFPASDFGKPHEIKYEKKQIMMSEARFQQEQNLQRRKQLQMQMKKQNSVDEMPKTENSNVERSEGQNSQRSGDKQPSQRSAQSSNNYNYQQQKKQVLEHVNQKQKKCVDQLRPSDIFSKKKLDDYQLHQKYQNAQLFLQPLEHEENQQNRQTQSKDKMSSLPTSSSSNKQQQQLLSQNQQNKMNSLIQKPKTYQKYPTNIKPKLKDMSKAELSIKKPFKSQYQELQQEFAPVIQINDQQQSTSKNEFPETQSQSKDKQNKKSETQRILLLNCIEFEKHIAPDELYFSPQENRKVHFSCVVRGITYDKFDCEYQFFNEVCQVEDEEEEDL